MKNKIIVSLLLVLLVAISASAVSASEDLSDTIKDASESSSDICLTPDSPAEDAEAITEISSSENNEDSNDELAEDKNTDKLLGDGGVVTGNNIMIKDISKFTQYVGKGEGDTYILNDTYMFNLTEPFTIEKSCTIKGGTIRAENLDYFFKIESPSNGGPHSVTIRDTTFIVTKDQNIIFANGNVEGLNKVLNIAGITLENITINIQADVDYVPENNALLFVNGFNSPLLTSNAMNISNNNLYGLKSVNFNNVFKIDGEFYNEATEIVYPKKTQIVSNTNAIHYAVDKAAGDSPFIFQLKLIDENGNAVVNKTISFALDGVGQLSAITDNDGIATLKLSLSSAKTYSIYSIFQENCEEYLPSNMVANTITIVKKPSYLTLKNLSYKVTATKTLTATFKDKNNKLIKNKKVTFTVNGKTYSATTNSKGVASVKITLNKKGTYTYTAKFAGDSTYSAVTKSAKLTVVPLATSLTTKKYSFKRYAKTKKLTTTLKSGKTVLKSQKVTFKVNGKTYTAKTNSKGIATVKIKLTKKGTFKYTVKYSGTAKYKAITKTNYVVIKK